MYDTGTNIAPCGTPGIYSKTEWCLVAMSVFLNTVSFSGAFAYPAILLPQLRMSSMRLSSAEESWLASIVGATMSVGNLIAVPAMRRGRKLIHYAVSLLNLTSWLVITLAPNFQVLLVGRVLQGLSYGLFAPSMSVILGEYTSPVNRGAFISTISIGQAIGVTFVHLVGSLLSWEDTALIVSIFPLISFAIIIFTPESPSWLAMEGRYDECRNAFRWLRGYKEEEELEKMIQARQTFNLQVKSGRSALREASIAFTKRKIIVPLVLGYCMLTIVSICGSVLLASYMTDILHILVGLECNVYAWMVACDVVRLVTNFAAVSVVRRLPRRTMLFCSGAACTSAIIAQAVYIYTQTTVLWLPAFLLFLQISTIGLGMATLPIVIIGEIFPLDHRSICSALSNLFGSFVIFLLLKTFPGMCSSIGLEGAYLFYAGILALALLVSWFLLPETRGRTLQEIEEHFMGESVVKEDTCKAEREAFQIDS